jgi:hypothetical protein
MNSGCPYCSGKKVLSGFNDLATCFPALVKEADGWDPSLVTFGSGKKLKWKCINGHNYFATISNRTKIPKGTGCPICVNKVVQIGINDLESKFPEIASEAIGWDPRLVSYGSNKKVDWVCPEGHKYSKPISSRTGTRRSGCPICSNRKLLEGFNDLNKTHPRIAKEANGWDPTKYFAGSPKKLSWRCPEGHIYEATIVNRSSHESGCPICSGRITKEGFNDLATRFPQVAIEAFEWDPSKVASSSHQVKSWICPRKHIYKATIAHRTSKDLRGCPICAGKQLLIGYNDLASKFPEIAKEADGWDPKSFTAGIDTKLNWKCNSGHHYTASVGSRTNLGTGCPVCANMQVLTGFNDLQTKNPLIAAEAYGWDTSIVLAGSKLKLKWKCPEGHIYTASVTNRTSAKPTGCPKCGKYGFDSTKEGFLYLIKNDYLQMLQIGITNDPDRRLKEHFKRDWALLELRGPIDGYLTRQWETSILRMLKAKGADLSNSKIVGKFDGYSEAWSESTFEVNSIKDLMRLTEEFEDDV